MGLLRRKRTRDAIDRELERQLVAHGRALEVPDPPDFAARVREALEREAPARRRRGRVVLLGTAAAAVAAVAVALDHGATRAVRIDALPSSAPRGGLLLGRPVTLRHASRLARFRILLPSGQAPDAVFYAGDPPRGRIALVYGSRARPRLLVTELRGRRVAPRLLRDVTTFVWLRGDLTLRLEGAVSKADARQLAATFR